MPAGRPLKYQTVEELQVAIEDYFKGTGTKSVENPNYDPEDDDSQQEVIVHQKPPTITGLAFYLGFTSRQAIMNYEGRPEFFDAIKTAKLRIEMHYEESLFGKNPGGPIFALKNFGWSDKQEIDQKTEISGTLSVDYTKLSDAALAEIAGLDRPKESKD